MARQLSQLTCCLPGSPLSWNTPQSGETTSPGGILGCSQHGHLTGDRSSTRLFTCSVTVLSGRGKALPSRGPRSFPLLAPWSGSWTLRSPEDMSVQGEEPALRQPGLPPRAAAGGGSGTAANPALVPLAVPSPLTRDSLLLRVQGQPGGREALRRAAVREVLPRGLREEVPPDGVREPRLPLPSAQLRELPRVQPRTPALCKRYGACRVSVCPRWRCHRRSLLPSTFGGADAFHRQLSSWRVRAFLGKGPSPLSLSSHFPKRHL